MLVPLASLLWDAFVHGWHLEYSDAQDMAKRAGASVNAASCGIPYARAAFLRPPNAAFCWRSAPATVDGRDMWGLWPDAPQNFLTFERAHRRMLQLQENGFALILIALFG